MSESNVYVGRKDGSHIDSGCCSSEETNSNSAESMCRVQMYSNESIQRTHPHTHACIASSIYTSTCTCVRTTHNTLSFTSYLY